MFKHILITLIPGIASVCSAMELAEKHFTELQAWHRAGQVDRLELLVAEAELMAAKCILNRSRHTPDEVAAMVEKALKLYEQATQLAEMRYKQGLGTYIDVITTKRSALEAGWTLHALLIQIGKESPCSGIELTEWQKLTAELNTHIEQQKRAGMVDTLELLAQKRMQIEAALFTDHNPENAELLAAELRQNYDEAESLALARYRAGFAGADTVDNIRQQRAIAEENIRLHAQMLDNNTTPAEVQQTLRRRADLCKQQYEHTANSPAATPATKLKHRLQYLLMANKSHLR